MSATHLGQGNLTRQDFLRLAAAGGAAAAGALLVGADCRAALAQDASGDFPFEGMTIGEVERLCDLEWYASLPEDVRAGLDASLMYETPETTVTRTGLAHSIWFSGVSTGSGQIGFTVSLSAAQACELFVRVTISSSNDHWDQLEYSSNGSTTYLGRSGTFYGVPSGTYSLVATGYSPNPPSGYTSSPVQTCRTVSV